MKKLEIKNNTGFYFPVCEEVINSKLTECGFIPTHVEVGLYGTQFVISICGDDNTGLRAYSVSKNDYDRIIGTVLTITDAYFGEISERDVARGYWRCDWFHASNKPNKFMYNDCNSHLVGNQAQAWCLVLGHLLNPNKNGHFNVQCYNHFEID